MPGKSAGPRARSDSVELSLEISASPETIFRFFTDRERFARWLSAGVDLDPREGGALRIDFQRFGTIVSGAITKIVPNRSIEFTWGVAAGPQEKSIPPGSTRVTITLSPTAGGSTLATLRHAGLPTDEEIQGHLHGWRHYLASLSLQSNQDQHGAGLQRLVADYVAAWNAADHPARAELLARACTEDVQFTSFFALTRTRGELADHIAGVSKMMPGLILALSGVPQLCHSSICFDWEVRAPDNTVVAKGMNYGEIDAGGKLTKLAGFQK